MSCCDTPGLLPLDQAREKIINGTGIMDRTEMCSLSQSSGRVLAEDVISSINVPGVDNSAMDGYALIAADLEHSSQLRLIGHSLAGHPFPGKISAGECVRIMTGASVPRGADAVMMQENTQADGELIHFLQNAKPGLAIRPTGQDIARDHVIFSKGHCVSPVDLGLLASLGIKDVRVYCKPVVAVFSTGDELKQPGTPLNEGDIYDSNRPAIVAMLEKLAVDVIDYGVIPDELDALRDVFTRANQEADIIVTSGGVSVGDADYTKDILAEQGEINFWKLAMKPGKPFAFGRLPDSQFFGLPGNPVSALVTFHQLALPAISAFSGQPTAVPPLLKAQCSDVIKKRPGRTDFQRGIYHITPEGELGVKNTGNQSSGVLTSLSRANCFIVLEQERGNIEVGEDVRVLPFDHFLRS